jgi:hypothetical protein
MPDPVIRWNETELAAIARQDYIRRALASYAGQIGAAAAADAPHSAHHHDPPSGHGADTIRGTSVMEDGQWTGRISWDAEHAYMRFPERAHHFLKRAAERYGRTSR